MFLFIIIDSLVSIEKLLLILTIYFSLAQKCQTYIKYFEITDSQEFSSL